MHNRKPRLYYSTGLGFRSLNLQDHISNSRNNIRSDGEGITGQFESKNSSWKDFKDEYQSVSKGMFSPHIDGTFLDGMFPIQNAMIKIGPPKMILLQPIEYDAVGGEIIFIDGKKVLESLLMERSKLAEILMKPGCISFCRDDQMSVNCSVYSHVPDGSIHVHFRHYSTTFTQDWPCEAIRFLHNNYHMNPKFQLNIRRVWINDSALITLKNLSNIYKHRRATRPYASYIPISYGVNYVTRCEISTGIRLNNDYNF
jgi:hypothetical protein